MKDLLIMRHAKSSWKEDDLPDHERPLKKRGMKDAARMGKLLKEKGLIPDKILSSTAVRAADTATIIAEKTNYKKAVEYLDKLYMAEGSMILQILQMQPKDVNVLLVIGHNPGMEALVQSLNKKVESLPSAAIAYFQADIKNWTELNKDAHVSLKKFWQPHEH
jgi:phosphohistidine phosphatase